MDLWLDKLEMTTENPFIKGFYHILDVFYYGVLILPIGVLVGSSLWKGAMMFAGL